MIMHGQLVLMSISALVRAGDHDDVGQRLSAFYMTVRWQVGHCPVVAGHLVLGAYPVTLREDENEKK